MRDTTHPHTLPYFFSLFWVVEFCVWWVGALHLTIHKTEIEIETWKIVSKLEYFDYFFTWE